MKLALISESEEENDKIMAVLANTKTLPKIYTEIYEPIKLAEKITKEESMREAISSFLKDNDSNTESLNGMIIKASEIYGHMIVFKVGKELFETIAKEYDTQCVILRVPFGKRVLTMIQKK
jgi:hypothetical protein